MCNVLGYLLVRQAARELRTARFGTLTRVSGLRGALSAFSKGMFGHTDSNTWLLHNIQTFCAVVHTPDLFLFALFSSWIHVVSGVNSLEKTTSRLSFGLFTFQSLRNRFFTDTLPVCDMCASTAVAINVLIPSKMHQPLLQAAIISIQPF